MLIYNLDAAWPKIICGFFLDLGILRNLSFNLVALNEAFQVVESMDPRGKSEQCGCGWACVVSLFLRMNNL